MKDTVSPFFLFLDDCGDNLSLLLVLMTILSLYIYCCRPDDQLPSGHGAALPVRVSVGVEDSCVESIYPSMSRQCSDVRQSAP